MAFLPVALAVASTAIEGISSFQQSMYQSAIAKNNARIAAQNADRASEAAQIEQMRSDREYASQEGTALAAQSASGLDVLGASQRLAHSNIARVRGEEAADIRKKGLLEVQNFQQEQANFLGESRAAKTNAWMGAAATAFNIGSTLSKPGVGRKFNSLIGGSQSTLGAG